MTFTATWSDPIDLNINDLCIYVGSITYCRLMPRVIYRVTGKQPSSWGSDSKLSRWHFTFKPAFDMFPGSDGSDGEQTKNGTRGIKKLELLDLGSMRQALDEFLIRWTKDV